MLQPQLINKVFQRSFTYLSLLTFFPHLNSQRINQLTEYGNRKQKPYQNSLSLIGAKYLSEKARLLGELKFFSQSNLKLIQDN